MIYCANPVERDAVAALLSGEVNIEYALQTKNVNFAAVGKSTIDPADLGRSLTSGMTCAVAGEKEIVLILLTPREQLRSAQRSPGFEDDIQ